jgi:hypothetical protein
MSISLQCPGCEKSLQIQDEFAGKRVKCANCGQIISVPTAQPASEPVDPEWHYVDHQQTLGPVPLAYLQQRVKSGLLKPTDRVWREGLDNWIVAGEVPELFPRRKTVPPPLPPEEEPVPSTPEKTVKPIPTKGSQLPKASKALYRPAQFTDLYMSFMLKYIAAVSLNVIFLLIVTFNRAFLERHLLAYLAAAVSAAIIITVLSGIFLYRAWAQIQDGRARTTPGKAVGFRFIPFFALYWEFVAVKGLAEDIEDYARARNIAIEPIPRSLTITYCVLMIVAGFLSAVPVLGPLLLISLAVVLLILFKKIADASAAIAEAKLSAAPAAGTGPAKDGTVQDAVAIVTALGAGFAVVEKLLDEGHH